MRDALRAALLTAALIAAGAAASADGELASYKANLAQASVSGLSSGAYMAGQFHVAFSSSLVGAAVIAGGPYDCAEGSVSTALNRCMATSAGLPDPGRLLQRAMDRAARGEIDPLAEMSSDRVYIFSGTQDATVTPPVVAAAVEFYRRAGLPAAQIALVDDMPAGHAFLTESVGGPCAETGAPFLNDCDYDQAGALLSHLYGPLVPPAETLSGGFTAFGQAEFLADPTLHGLASTGHVYVPAACAALAGCRVHIAFHGCRQDEAAVGDAFYRGAGYNRWADTNRIIMLYPQATATPQNPRGCWDWWGFDDARYAVQSGRQMAAVWKMLERVAGQYPPAPPFCGSVTSSNLVHWQAGRARVCDWWSLCTIGTGEYLGFAFAATTLYEHPPGNFGRAACE